MIGSGVNLIIIGNTNQDLTKVIHVHGFNYINFFFFQTEVMHYLIYKKEDNIELLNAETNTNRSQNTDSINNII